MKLVRYGDAGQEKPGMLDDAGRIRDIAAILPEIGPNTLGPESLDPLRMIDAASFPEVSGTPRLGAPFTGISKIVGVGLNYTDHALEAGLPIPDEPVLFLKATSAITGPNDDIVLPKGAEKTDWEVELGVVIGAIARNVAENASLGCVAGYCVANDVSERSFQLERGGQWSKGKSCDSFAPIGPWLVTADEIPDPQNLQLWLEVDGERKQSGSTQKMIFGVAYLVSYISRFMTLTPGDVIFTGTPAGVGLGMNPPRYLKPGQVMRLGIDGLGEQRHNITSAG